MPTANLSFDDDDSNEALYVLSGHDLMASHYDLVDLDWAEVAERTLIDERRGLVITQVVVIEDLIDEFILYLEDPPDLERHRAKASTSTAGQGRQKFERRLARAGLLDEAARRLISECRAVGERRNTLAHGTISPRLVDVAKPDQVVVPISEMQQASVALEWRLTDRRSGAAERISMARLRNDLDAAQALVGALLSYAEMFVERAPQPRHFAGGTFLSPPTP